VRVLFLGTPDFALPTLHSLIDSPHTVVGVFTNPDRPRGRSGTAVASPVKREATRHGLPVFQPARFNVEETYRTARELRPDVAVVVAYGCLLSASFLEIPTHGCINLHASLLPAYRGAAPIQWAVARGETRTGLTTMRLDEGMDTGDILLQEVVEMRPDESAAELAGRLAPLGGPLMVKTLAGLASGTLRPRPQPDQGVSRAPLLRREDGRIDWTWPAARVTDLVRGMQPWPVARTRAGDGWLRLFRAGVADSPGAVPPPGTVIGPQEDAVLIACGEGTVLAALEVQPDSRRRMSGREALNGRALHAGDRLGGDAGGAAS